MKSNIIIAAIVTVVCLTCSTAWAVDEATFMERSLEVGAAIGKNCASNIIFDKILKKDGTCEVKSSDFDEIQHKIDECIRKDLQPSKDDIRNLLRR